MAQYEAQCTKVGSFAYSQYFKLYVVLTNRDGNPATNQSLVDYHVYCQSSGSGSINAKHTLYFNLGGNVYRNETLTVNVASPNAYIEIAKGTMTATHNSNGTLELNFTASIQASSYGVSASISDKFYLTTIPRYANITSFSVDNLNGVDGLTKVKINWSADAECDYAWYSLDEGIVWYALPIGDIVEGLSPNTSYKFKLRIRRKDSQLTTDSNVITKSTYDISRISEVSDFVHGSNINVEITNPANISNLNLAMSINNAQILNRSVNTGNNTIKMTDDELDNLYKKYGSGNSLTASFVLSGSGYSEQKTCTVTLTGNQKTIYMSAKRGKVFVGTKRGVTWQNVNGIWKRGG